MNNMPQNIPHITFNSATTDDFGFEIITIKKIAHNKEKYTHNPELPHQLKFFNLIFFTQGKGKHFIDFKWYPVQKNTLIYLSKEQVNSFDFSSNLEGFCIIFTEGYFVDCFSNLSKSFVFRLFNPQLFFPSLQVPENSDFITYFNLLQKEFNNPNSFNQKAIIKSLFTILVSKVENLKQNQTFNTKGLIRVKVFHRFTSLIEKDFSKSRSADYYAAELAMTYKHLNMICKILANKTAKNVIDDFVILQAKRNLINSSLTITELSYKLGFNDPTNFSKYFKKHSGFTPKQFLESFSK